MPFKLKSFDANRRINERWMQKNVISPVFVSDVNLFGGCIDASTCQGHWAAAEIEARLRMKDFMEKEASNATQDAGESGEWEEWESVLVMNWLVLLQAFASQFYPKSELDDDA